MWVNIALLFLFTAQAKKYCHGEEYHYLIKDSNAELAELFIRKCYEECLKGK